MAQDFYFPYRGDLRAALGLGAEIVFVTVHPEGHPTALYRFQIENDTIAEVPLPCGGVALASDAQNIYIAGTDRRLYSVGKKVQSLGEAFADDLAALIPVAGDRLAVVSGSQLLLVSRADGGVLQTLELPGVGRCIATDKSGQWLAVGCDNGSVAVFDGQDRAEFEASESAKLHDGRVTAILFEPEELRFFSIGADNKLLSTHARGDLDAEDKGRGNNHENLPTALLLVPQGDRLLTGSLDATIKNWPRGGAIKPSTLKDQFGPVIALVAAVMFDDPVIVALCNDNTIRIVVWDAENGKFDEDELEEKITLHGAHEWAAHEFENSWNTKARETAQQKLAEWNDTASLTLLAGRIAADSDSDLRVKAAKLLGDVKNPRVVALLEPHLNHNNDKVRITVFSGLQKQLGSADLRPIDAAIATGKPEIGVLAVKALEPLATADDQAMARLVAALGAPKWDVRAQALQSLETVTGATNPQAGLLALQAKFGDIRAAALTRFFSRGLLADASVTSAIRRALEDDDGTVRRVAFLLSIESRPTLATVLRAQDDDLHRQLNELEKSEKAAPKPTAAKLDAADYDALLQATASRALDTCLRGAKGLAILRDSRAFSLLLQLSREEIVPARVDVCRALAALGDGRATNRLRSLLDDREASVRDAAYTAMVTLHKAEPLLAAEAGLGATEADVRLRGLQTLAEFAKATPPQNEAAPAWGLLVRTLNDGAPTVRQEAFKAALNRGIGGGGEATLRFIRQSIHTDVRREVLNEVTAQIDQPWAVPLQYEFFDDPAAELRTEAFEEAIRKNKELPPLAAMLKSRYPDARLLALDALFKKHSKPAQALLQAAMADGIPEVRRAAISYLIDDDARDALHAGLKSELADVRTRAAMALAKRGDAAALVPLRELAFATEPQEPHLKATWAENVGLALVGLKALGDPSVFAELLKLLDSPHETIRHGAAQALLTTARVENMAALRQAMTHADSHVRFPAALTLAWLGDATVGPLVRSDEAVTVLSIDGPFTAAQAQGSSGLLAVFLDNPDEAVRTRALFVHLLLELAGSDGTPDLCLQTLSAQSARLRLAAAQGLEAFHDRTAFSTFVTTTLNDRGDAPAWKIPAEEIEAFAAVLALAPSQLRALAYFPLLAFDEKEQGRWTAEFGLLKSRHAEAFATALAKAKPVPPKLGRAELRELAFGAYIGLVREQGGATATPAVIRIRQTALARIFALAKLEPTLVRAARPVLTQALGDPNQAVRLQAFDHLLNLGIDRATLSQDALEAGYTDLGVKGLQLLTEGTKGKDGDAVLERVLLSRTDDLALEAAKLLVKTRGPVPVATVALDAVFPALRTQAVNWLQENDPAGRTALRTATASRYRHVREEAALALAQKKDTAAFDTLKTLLKEATTAEQQGKLIAGFVALADPRAVDTLLDRVVVDPTGTAVATELIEAAGSFRSVASVERMLKLAVEKKEFQQPLFNAVYTASGFDQEEELDEEEPARLAREKNQHPRYPAVLAKLLEGLSVAGRLRNELYRIRVTQYVRGTEVDLILSSLSANPDEKIRCMAIETIAWRARERQGPVEPLAKALKHKDPTTQFFAAEGLARVQRPEGLQILLSSIEYLDDVELRQRAVLALGELADPRAVDVLVKLAGATSHALQLWASQAIGHLRHSPRGEAIGKLLERLAKSPRTEIARSALVGLRWFDSPSGWHLIQAAAVDSNWLKRLTACRELAFHDTPAIRDLLLKVVRADDIPDIADNAFDSAIKLFGPDSFEPHYAAIQNKVDWGGYGAKPGSMCWPWPARKVMCCDCSNSSRSVATR